MEAERVKQDERPFLKNLLIRVLDKFIPRLLEVPDLDRMAGRKIYNAKVVVPLGQELQTKKAEVTVGNLTDKEGNLTGIFLLGIQQEEGGNDRVFVCITKQDGIMPVLFFKRGLARAMAKIPGRTLHFWKVTDTENEPQITELVDPRVQLWDITKEKLPADIRGSIGEGGANIQAIIEAAVSVGYRIYISNQGSWARGPLPIPGWIEA